MKHFSSLRGRKGLFKRICAESTYEHADIIFHDAFFVSEHMSKNLLTSIKWQFIFAIGASTALSAQLENSIQDWKKSSDDFRRLNSDVFFVHWSVAVTKLLYEKYSKPHRILDSARIVSNLYKLDQFILTFDSQLLTASKPVRASVFSAFVFSQACKIIATTRIHALHKYLTIYSVRRAG